MKPCDLYKDSKFTWAYDGVPPNGKFDIELAPAPRFDISTYVKWDKCVGRGVRQYHRIDEYRELYSQAPGESWWGWKSLKKMGDNSWIPTDKKKARRWRTIKLCWRGIIEVENYELPTKKTRMKTALKKYEFLEKKPLNICPGGSRIIQGERHDQTTSVNKSSSLFNSTENDEGHTSKRLLIIANVPRSKRHFMSLWSILECFTNGVKHVILSAPLWSKNIVDNVISVVKDHIPAFYEENITIEAKFFENFRYDVGLWCDAIEAIDKDNFNEFGLINDSVFALRHFSGVYDALSAKNVSITSLSYSYSPKYFKGDFGVEHFWIESVFRGFTKDGINTFFGHSCVPADHPFFCPLKDDNKDCIVNNFEHDLAIEYPCDKVYGIFPSDTPENFLEKNHHQTWSRNAPYWRALVNEANFPVAKVKERSQIGKLSNPKLKTCTMHYQESFLHTIDFSLAKPRHRRKWEQLDEDAKSKVASLLDITADSWKVWTRSKYSQLSFDELSEEQQIFLTTVLDCSPKLWNKDECGLVA